MSLQNRLRSVMVCLVLEFGALIGMPMRPEEIKELMQTLNQPKVAHTTPADEDKGDDDR